MPNLDQVLGPLCAFIFNAGAFVKDGQAVRVELDKLLSGGRAHRIGQKANVTYVDLVSPGTIDERILTALRDKINIAGNVLGESTKDWLI